jgi:hypothetical protein
MEQMKQQSGRCKCRAGLAGIWAGMFGSFFLLVPSLALGQGCALCYTQAASSGARMIEALRSGILLLVVPPTLMSLGVIFVAYAKRNQYRQDADFDDESSVCEQDDYVADLKCGHSTE